jgi:hypothetical protein
MSGERRWFDFAALMIGIAGVLNGIDGISALVRKEYFVEESLIFQNLQVWAWVWIVVGIVQIVTASALVGGGGRKMAIAICAVSVLVHFASIGAYPLWSLVLMVVNVLIIYHLTTASAPAARVDAFPEPIAPPGADRPPQMR